METKNQCAAVVKKGSRCSRLGVSSISGYVFCTQHAKIEQRKLPADFSLLQKAAFEAEKQHMYRTFGYKMMGVKYMGFGGRLKTCAKKQTAFTWLLTANRLKSENKLTKDLINQITYILLWNCM